MMFGRLGVLNAFSTQNIQSMTGLSEHNPVINWGRSGGCFPKEQKGISHTVCFHNSVINKHTEPLSHPEGPLFKWSLLKPANGKPKYCKYSRHLCQS